MKDFFRQSMAWLHTWVGVLLGWVLYFMFITGTAGYLDTEIDRWMMPEASVVDYAVPTERSLAAAIDHLDAHAPTAQRWCRWTGTNPSSACSGAAQRVRAWRKVATSTSTS